MTGLGQAAGQTHFGIRAIDPRMRILAALAFGICVVSLTALWTVAMALGLALLMLVFSRQPVWQTLRRMAVMDGFIVFTLVLLPLTVPGPAALHILGLPASWAGLRMACEIILTANAVILALMTLVGSMDPVTLGHALHRLYLPDALVHLMMFTIRYVDVLRGEYLRLRSAMKVRGFRPGTNLHTYRSLGYLIGMILVRAIERSERILAAMKCRGFEGRIFLLQDFRLTPRDWIFTIIFMLALAVLLICDKAPL